MEPEDRIWRERGLREAVLAGDEAAWRALYEEHFAPLHAFLLRRTAGRIDRTEEVLSEAWMIAVRRIRRFDPARGSFGAWLRGIGENVLRNRIRRWRREAAHDGARPGADPAAPGADPAHGIEVAEKMALVFAALPPRYRDVLRDKYEARRSMKEIAERTGESVKAVESLLSRAREAFREAYRELEAEE